MSSMYFCTGKLVFTLMPLHLRAIGGRELREEKGERRGFYDDRRRVQRSSREEQRSRERLNERRERSLRSVGCGGCWWWACWRASDVVRFGGVFLELIPAQVHLL